MADQYVPRTGNSLQLLALVALGVFATRATWPWVAAAYALTCSVAAIVVVDDPGDVTPFRVVALMTMVTAPVAIGRYAGVRQAQARHAAELAAERARAGRLAERERIAREVHDIVAHHVGAMVLRASAAQYAGPTARPPRRWPTSGTPATACWRTCADCWPCCATRTRRWAPISCSRTCWPTPATCCATPCPGCRRQAFGWTCVSRPRRNGPRWWCGRRRRGSSRKG
ncbi:histidine kinase dimerization/phosphoacceptor domain-containing protein [Microbispora sp. GKU 823]|uniref:histidine kinase dimerization/phosphoacceptor domain-containing protein n=1 Tax=Microbispora sp. GKU 823 TaxID=1652100 RepID=UPI0009CBA22B|nr:histidine kinase dimerization/phosphoacceptor domain-containing protein [Microbispora sp. GKU 823]OPG13467.1 hypothetical protein B1L11_08325 [Microbispora sp. GKU 823]